MTITQEFAKYCTELTYEDLDAHVVEYSKQLLLDSIGTTVGGYHWTDSADVMTGTARDLDTGSGVGTATVLATGERFSPSNAVLANGALSHSLDYDNRHSAGSLHIGSSVVNAALAAAESGDTDGKTLLEGIVAGYDVAARLGMACNPRSSHERGFHPTGTCGTFGATAAVGVIEGLDADDLATAFGVNGSQASGGYQCSLTGGWNKRIHPGLAARSAFASVTFARNGFEGPTAPIEGELGFLQAYASDPDPGRATTGLGEVYEAAQTKIKPYPLGTFTHVPIALLIDIVETNGIDPAEIQSVSVEMPTSGAAMFGRGDGDGHPTSSAEAQFDMPFASALAVTHRNAGLRAFDTAVSGEYTDEFARLMDVTTTVGSDELEAALPELYPARVTVATQTDTYERFREWVEGEPDHPMSWEDLTEKFDDLAIAHDEATRATVVERVRNCESHTGTELVDPFRS